MISHMTWLYRVLLPLFLLVLDLSLEVYQSQIYLHVHCNHGDMQIINPLMTETYNYTKLMVNPLHTIIISKLLTLYIPELILSY